MRKRGDTDSSMPHEVWENLDKAYSFSRVSLVAPPGSLILTYSIFVIQIRIAKLILNVFWGADVVQGGSICRCILLHNFLWISAFTWSLEWSNILSTAGMPSRNASFHNQRKCRENDLIYGLQHLYLVDERISSFRELTDVCSMVESPVVFLRTISQTSGFRSSSDVHLRWRYLPRPRTRTSTRFSIIVVRAESWSPLFKGKGDVEGTGTCHPRQGSRLCERAEVSKLHLNYDLYHF